MTFKQFITRQRVIIFIIGIVLFSVSLFVAHWLGYTSLPGALATNLAASSVTIVLTALIIDFLGVREAASKISDVAALAEEEIYSICSRAEWQIAQLFGLKRDATERNVISTREEARAYIQKNNELVQSFLSNIDFNQKVSNFNEDTLNKFTDRLQHIQTQLEETLVLYEYALAYDFRARALALRQELRTTERLFSFIDFSGLGEENDSLVRLTMAELHDAAQDILSVSNPTTGA